MNIGETWSFSLPGMWSKVTSSKKNRRWYFRQRSWFALARGLFHKQRVDDQKSINKFGSSRNILSRRAQMSTEICIKLFTRKRIQRRDRRLPSLLSSLSFYQTILESSLQTRFMFDIKEIIINRCANICSRRNTGRPVENCDRFAWIPSNSQRRSHCWLQQSRKYSTTCNFALLSNSVCYSLCCVRLRHDHMKLIYCGVLFLEGFSAKQQKTPKKKGIIAAL